MLHPIAELSLMLKQLAPQLMDGEYVFCHYPDVSHVVFSELQPLCVFQEREGSSLIIEKQIAQEYKIEFATCYRAILLQVYSSLDAVGLTASVSTALAAQGISANMIAAFHHDYILIPSDDADKAIEILSSLSR